MYKNLFLKKENKISEDMLLHNLINERIELLLNGLEEETNNADK